MEKSSSEETGDAQSFSQHEIVTVMARFKQDWYAVTKSLNEIQILIEKQHENLQMITAIALRLSQIRNEYSCQFFDQEQLKQSADQDTLDLP